MKEFSLDYLRCVNCCSKLELNVFSFQNEIEEGMLECKNCKSQFPIIEKIPILWSDFSEYLANRRSLGGKLFHSASGKMKGYVKKSLTSQTQKTDDRTNLESRWADIYQKNHRSKFYSTIKKELEKLAFSNISLEYGCSVGTVTNSMADLTSTVFGIDRSFSAIKIAKTKKSKDNLDYFIADLLSPVFGQQKFNLIVALNLLELVEPLEFLTHVASKVEGGSLVISDPYDYDRGKNSVKGPLDEKSLRQNLKNLGFKISKHTINPSKIPWMLNLNPRTTLNYKVDLVIAKK